MKRLFLIIFLCLAASNAFAGGTMFIKVDNVVYEVELYDNSAAKSLADSLPQNISMSRWGGEYYGKLSGTIDISNDKTQDVFKVGEVALWVSGNSLCIFFGPTPASKGTEPRMASPGVALGLIKGDVSALNSMSSSINAVVTLVRD